MAVEKRSVMVVGHRTSVSLEAEFWQALKEAAARRGTSLNRLIARIDETRDGNLSSALRVFALAEARRSLIDERRYRSQDQLPGPAAAEDEPPP